LETQWRRISGTYKVVDVGGEAGRSIVVGRHEDRIAAARAAQHEPPTRALLRRRAKVERKIDHLQDLGMRKARYRGRRKTKLQAFLAATVANFKRLAVAVREDCPSMEVADSGDPRKQRVHSALSFAPARGAVCSSAPTAATLTLTVSASGDKPEVGARSWVRGRLGARIPAVLDIAAVSAR
jgi:Transposase DDE domain